MKIAIEFKDGQGLGNQLWYYMAGLGISKKKKYDLEIYCYDKFKAKNFINLYGKKKEGICRYKKIEEISYYDEELNTFVTMYDKSFEDESESILIDGNFQDIRYFENIIKIDDYIKINNDNYNKINGEYCIINLRGGEYRRHKNLIIPKDYWLKAINLIKDRIPSIKFLIVTDDKSYAKKLLPQYEIVGDTIEECYLTIYNAKNIIISNSSFAYFPIITGNKKNVIAPFQWSRFNNKVNRWICPGNYDENWNWLDINGNIKSKYECKKNISETREYYTNSYRCLQKKISVDKKLKLKNVLPKKIKFYIKKIIWG